MADNQSQKKLLFEFKENSYTFAQNQCEELDVRQTCPKAQFVKSKLQLIQKFNPNDNGTRFEICENIQQLMENNYNLQSKILFSNEVTFHMNLEVNMHNRIMRA